VATKPIYLLVFIIDVAWLDVSYKMCTQHERDDNEGK
jgi:hypothetical protein